MSPIVQAFFINFLAAVGFASAKFVIPINNDGVARIVNGANAELGQIPHQVSLRSIKSNNHLCAGSIITSRWIITAAHCVQDRSPSSFIAFVGAVKLSDSGVIYKIAEVHGHPRFRESSFNHDIALIQTAEDIQFNEFVQPIGLPTENTPGDITATVSGWGCTGWESSTPDHLQYLETQTLSVEACRNEFRAIKDFVVVVDFNEILCARAGACKGDSGGPLTTADKILVGIVSWKINDGYYPNGYTRVFAYLDFIKETIGGNLTAFN